MITIHFLMLKSIIIKKIFQLIDNQKFLKVLLKVEIQLNLEITKLKIKF